MKRKRIYIKSKDNLCDLLVGLLAGLFLISFLIACLVISWKHAFYLVLLEGKIFNVLMVFIFFCIGVGSIGDLIKLIINNLYKHTKEAIGVRSNLENDSQKTVCPCCGEIHNMVDGGSVKLRTVEYLVCSNCLDKYSEKEIVANINDIDLPNTRDEGESNEKNLY